MAVVTVAVVSVAVIYIVSPVRSERSSLVGWRCWRCPKHPSIQDSSKTGLSVTNLVRATLSTSVRELETKPAAVLQVTQSLALYFSGLVPHLNINHFTVSQLCQ